MNRETLAAARLGDRQAVESLLRELQDPWYRLCLSLLRDADAAMDATQETALRFLKQLPNFRGDSQLRTWALGIAINVVREARRKKRFDAFNEEADEAVADHLPSPFDCADSIERHTALRDTLAELPERQREAVVLRYFEDMSTEQAAAAMKCAPGTVKATLHQALRSLKNKLGVLL